MAEGTSQINQGQIPSKTRVSWLESQQKALETLINCITSPPILVFPDPSLPYIVHTDASAEGLGAVLYQEQDEKMRVIA